MDAMTTQMVKKPPPITFTRSEDGTVTPGIDFAEAIKDKYFERVIEDMQTGYRRESRVSASDTGCAGLRVKINKSGHVSYHVQFTAPETPPRDLKLDADDLGKYVARPYLKVGTYPETPLATVRQRARTIRALADMGINVAWGGWSRLMHDLDVKGLKWRP